MAPQTSPPCTSGRCRKFEIVIGIDMRAGLQADDGAETFGMFERQMQRDAAADRAADHDRPVELERGR